MKRPTVLHLFEIFDITELKYVRMIVAYYQFKMMNFHLKHYVILFNILQIK